MNTQPDRHDARSKPKIVVGTGWWSGPPTMWNLGDDLIRSPQFFKIWHRQVLRYLDPIAILVTDSRSPIKPDFRSFARVQVIETDRNYGHSNDIRIGKIQTKFCGLIRSVLMSACFAVSCDADYYVYVEQDCLIRGERFLSTAMGALDQGILCGQRTQGGRGIENRPAAPMLQQSLMIVRNESLERFITAILKAPESDGELSPEVKMERDLQPFGEIVIPYGRSRPIDFSLSHFYAQHLTRDELIQFLKVEGLVFSDWFDQ